MAAFELNNTILKNSANLKAYYRFESGALTTDSSGNGKTLTNNNSVASASGVFGGSASLGATNSTNKCFTVNTSPISGSNAPFTLIGWFKFNAVANNALFINTSETATDTFTRFDWYQPTSVLRFYRVRNGIGQDGPTYSFTPTVGTWYHLAMTYNGSKIYGYVNGSVVATGTSTGNGSVNQPFDGLCIGSDPQSETTSTSTLDYDDLAVFNTVLTSDQIKELYEGRAVGELWPQLFSAELNNSYLKNSSLKLYYRFEETSGTAITDSSGTGNNATASRTNILNNSSGKYGNRAVFVRASTDRITAASPTGIPTGSSAFTVAGWIKPSAYDDAMTVYGWGAGALGQANAFRLKTPGGNGVVHFFWNKDLSANVAGLTDGNFHHFAVTYAGSGGARRIYVDGSQVATDTPTGVNVASSDIIVGGYSADYFNGDIDDFGIWNVELTAGQISQLYSQTNGLQGLWHLNNGTTDVSGNSYNLTNNGSTTFVSGKFGQAASFNGSSQSLSITNASCPNLNIIGSQTWMCWFKTNVNNADKAILSKHDGTNYRLIQIGPSAQLIGYFSGLGTNSSVSTPNSLIQTGRWYFMAWIYDLTASKIKLWVDMNKYEATATGTTTSNSGDFRIGNDRTQWYFNGLIDEVSVFNRALSDKEIRNYYAWTTGRFGNIA